MFVAGASVLLMGPAAMADLDGVPIDQFIMSAVDEKISALTAETYLRTRADRADPAALRAILDKVPLRAPLAGDE